MDHRSVLTDEHVPGVVITTLRAHGYSVVLAKERYGERTTDRAGRRQLLEALGGDLIREYAGTLEQGHDDRTYL